jgi:hypothetical protein
MRKAGYIGVAVAFSFLLLAVIVFLPSGAGSGALDSEKVFIAEIWNSLYYLDQAKWKWAEEKDKSEGDVPAMEDLMPYLGDRTNRINRLVRLGINFKITPISDMEHQSEMATLTRDLRFRGGICRFYPAGSRYGFRTGWDFPKRGSASSLRGFYFNNRERLAVALFLLAMGYVLGYLLVFAIKKVRNSRQTG